MKVIVPVKRVVDYNVKVRVKSDGTCVDIANVKMSWADGRISSIALAADPMRLLSRISRHWFRTAVTGLFHRIFISMKRGEWLPILWDCLAVFLLRRTSTVAVQARCWKLTRARARSLATQMFTWSALPLSRR